MELFSRFNPYKKNVLPSNIDGEACALESVQFNKSSWFIDSTHKQNWLDQSGQIILDQWICSGVTDVVKDGPHRTVYRLTLPEGEYYLKHYKVADWKTGLQNVVRKSRAALEFTAIQRVANLELPTTEVVALGEMFHGPFVGAPFVGDSYLVTRAIPQTVSLHDFLDTEFDRLLVSEKTSLRQQIAQQLGYLIGTMHGHRLFHHDLHAGNVLIRCRPNGNCDLSIIDLHALCAQKRFHLQHALRNLDLFNNFFVRRAEQADFLRFLKAYWQQVAGGPDQSSNCSVIVGLPKRFGDFSQQVAAHCRLSTQLAYRSGDRKWQRANRRLKIVSRKNRDGRYLRSLNDKWVKQAIESPSQNLASSNLGQLIVEADKHSSPNLQLVIRHRATKSQVDKNSLRNVWEVGHALRRRRVSAVLPLLHLEENAPSGDAEYLVLQKRDDAVSVQSWFAENCGDARNKPKQKRLVGELAQMLATEIRWLHECGISHDNLSLENITVVTENGKLRVCFEELQGVYLDSKTGVAEHFAQIGRLAQSTMETGSISLTTHLRFLKRYLFGSIGQRSRSQKTTWKTAWRKVESNMIQRPPLPKQRPIKQSVLSQSTGLAVREETTPVAA